MGETVQGARLMFQPRAHRLMTRLAFLAAAALVPQGCAGPESHSEMVNVDPPLAAPGQVQCPPATGVRVTYLGTNAFLLEAADAVVLVDPYFSRIALVPVALNWHIEPNVKRIEAGLARLPRRIDLILVTHAHFDHLLDVPEIAQRTGARVLASPTGCYLARAVGLPTNQAVPVEPGQVRTHGRATVRVFEGKHDRLFGRVPYPGALDNVPPPPVKVSDWVLGTTLAFVIEMGGQRIYVDSGGTKDMLPPANQPPMDLAILGVSLSDGRARLVDAVKRLRPRYFLPSHQDNFFTPLEEGFHFNAMTDFSFVRRQVDQHCPDAKLILLDYFTPWTLR